MARYRVLEYDGTTGEQTEAYAGEVDPWIVAGLQSLQLQVCERRYWFNGTVFYQNGGRVPGVLCKFERME